MTQPDLDRIEDLLRHLEDVENQLNDLQEGLTRAHRLATLGTMASIIAHEFNNILTPVITYCQMALNEKGEDVELNRKALTRAFDGATKASRICSSILGFARANQPGHVSCLAMIVDDVFQCIARDPAKDRIALDLDVPDDLHVRMDPVAVQQVLLNLFLNAREVMRDAGGTLSIHAERHVGPAGPSDDDTDTITSDPASSGDSRQTGPTESDPGDWVRLVVADTGPGIPPDVLDRLFEPFVTQRSDAKRQGTGLGLTICRDLVQRAGGRITVRSAVGEGATFTLMLPRATAADVGQKQEEAA